MAKTKSKTKKNSKKKEQALPIDLLTDKSDDLLLRHEKFIDAYLECLNGTQAWQDVHPEASYAVASQSASRLLRNVKIKAELERRFSELTMGKKEVLARLRAIANATLFPFIKIEDEKAFINLADPNAKKHLYLIKKFKHSSRDTANEKTGQVSSENWAEIELHDAMRALELIGKYHALFTEKTDSTEKKVIRVTIRKEDA